MIATNEDALECDLCETYGIMNYRELPADRVALFACGLRQNSRIKLEMGNMDFPLETFLLASAVDRLSYLLWQNGRKDSEKPKSIAESLMRKKKDYEVYNSPEEFMEKLNKIKRRG
jgi:hypothetical protein